MLAMDIPMLFVFSVFVRFLKASKLSSNDPLEARPGT